MIRMQDELCRFVYYNLFSLNSYLHFIYIEIRANEFNTSALEQCGEETHAVLCCRTLMPDLFVCVVLKLDSGGVPNVWCHPRLSE